MAALPHKKYLEIYEWITLMIKMQARACIISKIAGVTSPEARKIWREETGRSSPSGQQPTDSSWFLKTPIRRFHAALILQLYARSVKILPEYAAFAHCYYHYARITAGIYPKEKWVDADPAFREAEDDYVIPFSRAYFLVSTYTDDEVSGVRCCELQVRKCRNCNSIFLSHVQEIQRKCPQCCAKKPEDNHKKLAY